MSEKRIIEYGSSVSSVDRVGTFNMRSALASSAAHLWYGSEMFEVTNVCNTGSAEYPGRPALSHAAHPLAFGSPILGNSDSQNSSRESSCVGNGNP